MAIYKISKGEQFYHENKTWERAIDFYKQENSYLKTRLSEVVDQQIDTGFLALAEHFQNQFILKDEFIRELQQGIHSQQTVLKNGFINEGPKIDNHTIKSQEKLRNEIEYLEKDFARLRNEFNKYLAKIL